MGINLFCGVEYLVGDEVVAVAEEEVEEKKLKNLEDEDWRGGGGEKRTGDNGVSGPAGGCVLLLAFVLIVRLAVDCAGEGLAAVPDWEFCCAPPPPPESEPTILITPSLTPYLLTKSSNRALGCAWSNKSLNISSRSKCNSESSTKTSSRTLRAMKRSRMSVSRWMLWIGWGGVLVEVEAEAVGV